MAKKTSLELAVDSGRWDAGLRKAQTELNRFIQTQGGLEAAMKADSQAMTEFIGMMGNMESTAKTARGQVNEYRATIEQLSRTYNQLSESEKSSDIGRALSQSIEQLTGRMRDAQNEMRNTSQLMGEQKDAGGELGNMLDGIAGKFGISTKALTVWGAALAGVTTALNVAKDAFFNNEQYLDEWGRTVAASESVYKAFLNSINTGDISGFLSNISTIVQAARDAYDALDELATFNAFNKANIASARADLQGSIADYREGNGSKENVQKASDALIKELETKQELQVEAYEKVVSSVALERQVNPEDLLKVMRGDYGTFKQLKDLEYTGKEKQVVGSGMYARVEEVAVPANERERLAQAVKHLNDTEIDNFQSIAEAAKMTQVEINNQRKMVARVINGRNGGMTGGSSGGGTRSGTVRNGGRGTLDVSKMAVPGLDAGDLQFHGYATTQSMADMQQQLQQYQKALKDATTQAEWEAATEGVTRMKALIEAQPFALKMGVDADTVVAWREEAQARMDEIEPIKIGMVVEQTGAEGLNKGKEVAKDWNMAAGAIRDVGHALSGLDDPAARVMGTIAQAIASVALGYGQAMSAKDSTASGWAWLGFAATATATMLSSIAAIRNATAGSYAQGGIVPGTDWHDGLTANVSSGELILNQAQQGNLASQLRNDVGGGAQGSVVRLRGEDLWFAISTHLRRVGKGEIINLTTH